MLPSVPFVFDTKSARPALKDDASAEWVTYAELSTRAAQWSGRLPESKCLVFLYIRNTIEDVAALLGAMATGHAVALFDPALTAIARSNLEQRYRPDWVIEPGAEKPLRGPLNDRIDSIAPPLSLLLSTSGSTGSPKLVRLTRAAVEANATAIAEVLEIGSDDTAAGYLPLHYSYGLSVLTSHLCRGARILLTDHGLMHSSFWPAIRAADVTHLPGVPFHFQIMTKLGFNRLNLASLRTLTQAGGNLDVETRRRAHAFMNAAGGRFYVLYGQTEAAPRMTTLQHEAFETAETSVGTALPGCRIEILNPDATGAGEIVFHGPNVMLGYAERREDLALGDVEKGRLLTGDIGRLDESGRLFITGRAKRFAKVYGLRVNLDDLEQAANEIGPAAVVQNGEGVKIYLAGDASGANLEDRSQSLLAHMLERFTLSRASFEIVPIDAIPRTERGKIDYRTLEGRT